MLESHLHCILFLQYLQNLRFDIDAINNIPKAPITGRFIGIYGKTVSHLIGATKFILTIDPLHPRESISSGDVGWHPSTWTIIMYLDGICYGMGAAYTSYGQMIRNVISFDPNTGTFGQFYSWSREFNLNSNCYYFYCVWK